MSLLIRRASFCDGAGDAGGTGITGVAPNLQQPGCSGNYDGQLRTVRGAVAIGLPTPAPFQGAHASVAAFPVVTLGLHHRLISAAPPARRFVGKLMATAPRAVPEIAPFSRASGAKICG